MQSFLTVLRSFPETSFLDRQERVLHQVSGGEAILWQPLHTASHKVDGKLAHVLILDRREQAFEAYVGNGVDWVNPFALLVPVNARGCALVKESLRWRPEKGMVLG